MLKYSSSFIPRQLRNLILRELLKSTGLKDDVISYVYKIAKDFPNDQALQQEFLKGLKDYQPGRDYAVKHKTLQKWLIAASKSQNYYLRKDSYVLLAKLIKYKESHLIDILLEAQKREVYEENKIYLSSISDLLKNK